MISNESKNSIIKVYFYEKLLFAAGLAFTAFYLVLSFYNRPAYDDMIGIYYANANNVVSFVTGMYQNISGRWISWAYQYLVIYPSSNFQQIHIFIFIYYCATLFILIFSINKLIRFGLKYFFDFVPDTKTSISYSIISIASFYFFTFQNIETWWYFGASLMYLQGIVFFLLGAAMLFYKKKNLWHYVLIIISFFYAGGCYELYSIIFCSLASLFLFFAIALHKNQLIKLKTHWFTRGFLVAFFSLFISSLICVLAKSNINRQADYMHHFKEFYDSTSFSDIINFHFSKKFFIASLCSSCWFILGMNVKQRMPLFTQKKSTNKILFSLVFVCLFSFAITFLFQTIFLKGILIPARGWAFTSFMVSILISYCFFHFGFILSIPNYGFQNAIKVSISLIVFFVFLFNLGNQFLYAKTYSNKYDEMINLFLEKKKNNFSGILTIDKLPDSGMLMNFDMEDDSHNPMYLKKILGIEYEIKVRK